MSNEEERKIQTCRFYEAQFPQEDDLVVVEVVNVEENASYVSLLEYNRIEGMITPNELTTGMKQSINKALRLGKQEVVRVLRVDAEKGYIDLSKRKVPKQEELVCIDKFTKSKQCNAMLVSITEKTKRKLSELYENIIYPLYKSYSHPIEAFQKALNDNSIIHNLNESEEVKTLLLAEIQRRLQPQTIKVKAEFELSCYGYEGVNAIKKALKVGESLSQKNCVIKYYIVGSPVYSGAINTPDRQKGIKLLNESLQKIEEEISKVEGGKFKIKTEPKVYGEKGNEEQEHLEEEKQEIESGSDSDISGMGDADEDEED